MVSTAFLSAFAAAASLLSLSAAQSISEGEPIPTPTVSVTPNAFSEVGCFSNPHPLVDHGSYNFQSIGNCQMVCVMLNKPVMGLAGGTNCSCGDMIPPQTSQVDNGTCSTSCAGFDKQNCGGGSAWWVVLTGTTRNKVNYFSEPSSSAQPQTQVTVGGSTVVVMATPTATPTTTPSHKSSGSNKAGIAAGVVVGVVVLAAIVGGVVFFLRQKRRKQIEEEYRRQAQVNSFVAGGKPHTSHSSMTDSRLDPEFAGRRGSTGSIADNADYSRRILQVTNPDGR